MNNTEATLDGRKRVGFRNNIKTTSSKVNPDCMGRVTGSLGSGPQDSPSPGDFPLISLVPQRVRKTILLPHPVRILPSLRPVKCLILLKVSLSFSTLRLGDSLLFSFTWNSLRFQNP